MRVDVSRGRRGELRQLLRGAGSRDGVSRGRRGGMVDDACVKRMADVRVAWQAWDSVGVWEDARQWIRVTGVRIRAF